MTLAILEESIRLAHQPQGNLNEVEGAVISNSYRGGRSLITLRVDSVIINAQVAAATAEDFVVGQPAWATMLEKDLVMLDAEGSDHS